jgi:endogenous inhibitor of DNA gyrase (YacG/DUF329 family)
MSNMPVTVNCPTCGVPVTRPPSHIGKGYCSKACAYDARRKENPSVRRIVYKPDHPLAGATGYVSEARLVLYAKIGPGSHPCHWCGEPVEWMVGKHGGPTGALIATHVNNDALDNSPNNLVPSCQSCNIWRKRRNGRKWDRVEDHEQFVLGWQGQRLRMVELVCSVCQRHFLRPPSKVSDDPVVCGKVCARRL